MKGRLETWTTSMLAASLTACIVPVYGTGAATNVYCPPDGVCADGGTTGGTASTSSSGTTTGTASSSGSSGSTSSGTGTGSSSSSGSSSGTGGGCGAHDGGTELQGCTVPSDCNCPELCVAIPGAGNYCETPCTSFSDCDSLELCANGYCALTSCASSPPFTDCLAGNGAGGYCFLEPNPQAASGTTGLCFPAGSADGGCIPATTGAEWASWNAAGACIAGEFCAPVNETSGVCVDVCDGGAPCPGNQTCTFTSGNPFTGFCIPCSGANQVSCGLSCFDPATDDLNCGGCDIVCSPGTACFGGRCTRPAPLISPRYGLAAATGPDGLIYLVGGQSGVTPLGLAEAFNPRTNGWTTLPSMSTQRLELGAAWGNDGQLHAVGGYGTGTNCPFDLCSTDEAFNGTSWAVSASALPASRVGSALAADPSGIIYVAGGGDVAVSKDLYQRNPADGGWNTLQAMDTAREFTAGTFGADHRFYVLGGQDGNSSFSSVEAYDPSVNAWDETLPGLPSALAYLSAAARRRSIYAIGGGAGDGGFFGQASVYRLDLDTCDAGCAWRQDAPLQQGRGGNAAVLGADGRLYVLGGLVQYSAAKGGVYSGLPSVEVYDPAQPDGGWVSSICPPGSTSFGSPDASYAATGNPGSEIATGDLNSDGFPDVVTLSSSSFSTFLNDSAGGLLSGTALSGDAGTDGLHGLALADFNKDGNLDGIAVSPDFNQLYLGLGDGKGGLGTKLQPYTTTSGTAETSGARGTAVADFNGDGWPDVAVANAGGSTIGILLNQNNVIQGFTGFKLSSFSTCANPVQVAAADLNGDGAPDLVVVCTPGSGGSVAVLLNNGFGTGFSSGGQLVVSNPASVAIADFDLDGLPDISVGTSSGSGVTVFLNQGGTVPSFIALLPVGHATTGGLSLTLADLDGDGYPDIVGSDYADQTVYLFRNSGGTGILPTGIYPTPNGDSPAAATVADMRLDGWNDLLTLNYTANTVNVWLSNCPP
jgi:hypothetical protein